MAHPSIPFTLIFVALYFSGQMIFLTWALKVGSRPNDDNSVQILFCPFLCSS